LGLDRLEINRLGVRDKIVDLVFQRVGDRVVVYSPGGRETSIPIVVRV
jgi:hypothetical protein